MAKQYGLTEALAAVTAALKIESIPNPTDEQKEQIHQAKVKAAGVIDDSNFVKLAEDADERIAEEARQEEERRLAEEAEAAADEADQPPQQG